MERKAGTANNKSKNNIPKPTRTRPCEKPKATAVRSMDGFWKRLKKATPPSNEDRTRKSLKSSFCLGFIIWKIIIKRIMGEIFIKLFGY